jgi:phosphopantothenate-cysteine ligase
VLNITLYPVKKEMYEVFLIFRYLIKDEWNPKAFVITFKLETDEEILLEKAKKSLLKTGCNYVVANTLQDRYKKVTIVGAWEKLEIFKNENEHIEEMLIKELIAFHHTYTSK